MIASDFSHQLRIPEDNDWVTLLLLLALALLAWVRTTHPRRLGNLWNAFRFSHYVRLIIKEKDTLMSHVVFALNGFFFFVMALFVFQAGKYFQWNFVSANPWPAVHPYLLILGFLACLYSLKRIFLKLAGIIFDAAGPFEEYIFIVFLINQMLALILLPLLIAIVYIPETTAPLLITGLGITISMCLYRFYRGWRVGASGGKAPWYYLFLYFCGLEVLPTILLVKFFDGVT